MAKYTATAQTVAINNSVKFLTETGGKCNIRHKEGTGVFTLKGSGNCCNPARYRVSAHVVVTAATPNSIRFALYEDGEQLTDTLMAVVPASAGNVLSMQTETEVVVDCACSKLSLRAITDNAPLTAANMIITRVA